MDFVSGNIKSVTAFTPRAISGEVAESGNTIDRKGYNSAVFTLVVGDYTSDPSAIDVACALQTKSGETDSWQDALDVDGSVITTRISGEVSNVRLAQSEINVDLRSLQRYVKLTVAADFTGGTSPTLFFASTASLGEPSISPAV